MKKPMADIAAAALDQERNAPGSEIPDTYPLDLEEGPAVADVWIDGDLGFVLLVHRRDDGFIASEMYYSLKGEDNRWTDAEPLSGGIFSFDLENPSAADDILSDASVVVLSETESSVFTGHSDEEDGYELVRLYEILVSENVRSLRIEKTGPKTRPESVVSEKGLTSRVAVVAVRPGERLHVIPIERSGSKSTTSLELLSSST
ncbi:hypothetical protein [Actinacidiphila glaucinigra]